MININNSKSSQPPKTSLCGSNSYSFTNLRILWAVTSSLTCIACRPYVRLDTTDEYILRLDKPVGDRFARSYLYATSMFLCLN